VTAQHEAKAAGAQAYAVGADSVSVISGAVELLGAWGSGFDTGWDAATSAAGLHVLTTAAELDALPEGSIIVDAEGLAHISQFDEWEFPTPITVNWCPLDSHTVAGKQSRDMAFPVTIVHRPETKEPIYDEGGIGDE
jgi:hypothetical protein